MKNIFKKILALWLVIYLTIAPPFVYAASPTGWAFSAFDVATSVVTAMKNGASSSVAIAKSPISAKIARGIAAGAIAGAALPLAISQLTGIALNAVDWVFDADNNAIRYKIPADSSAGWTNCVYRDISYSSPQKAWEAYLATTPNSSASWKYTVDQNGFVSLDGVWGTGISCKVEADYGSIPISTVADKIFDNAKTDSASASIVNDAVKDYVNEGFADVALDNAKANDDASHACGTGTHWSGSACVADDTPFDPSGIIDAIKSVFDAITALAAQIFEPIVKVINDAWEWAKTSFDWIKTAVDAIKTAVTDIKTAFTGFVDWVKTTYDEFVKPDDSPTDVDVDIPQTQTIDTDINFGGSCPANITGSFVIGGQTTTFNIMDWSQFCLIMSTYLKPLVIALASFHAVRILAGRNESN